MVSTSLAAFPAVRPQRKTAERLVRACFVHRIHSLTTTRSGKCSNCRALPSRVPRFSVYDDDDEEEDEDEKRSPEEVEALRSGWLVPPDDDELGPEDIVDGKPMWLRDLERDIERDPEVREVLEGTDGDPEKVRMNMRRKLAQKEDDLNADFFNDRMGVPKPMRVTFRSMDPMCVYFWLEMYRRPGPRQLELLNEVIRSWFVVGKLGGYNAMNLQIHSASEHDLSYMPYRSKVEEGTFTAYYHELSELEEKDQWVRFRADLGTGDEIGLDILINMLQGLSSEHLGIKQLCIGGYNSDWPIPQSDQEPQLTMNPMSVDGGDDEEFGEEEEELPKLDDLPQLLKQYQSDPDKYGKLKELQRRLDNME